MVLAYTLKEVLLKLSPSEPKSRRHIVEATGLASETVRRTLIALVDMGLVERIVYTESRASGHKNGRERVGYKMMANASAGNVSVGIEALPK